MENYYYDGAAKVLGSVGVSVRDCGRGGSPPKLLGPGGRPQGAEGYHRW